MWNSLRRFLGAVARGVLRWMPSAVLDTLSARMDIVRRWRRVIRTVPPPSGSYHSQYGQDVFLAKLLEGRVDKGFFVDIGAYDGVTNSNTLLLERQFGYEGLLVEPNPRAAAKARNSRVSEVVNCGIAEISGQLRFIACDGYGEQLSCFRELADHEHLKRIACEQMMHGFSIEELVVDVVPIANLLSAREVRSITVLSVDAEGAEYAILKSFPFGSVSVSVVIVEANNADDVEDHLEANGFLLRAVVGTDLVFVRRSGI